MWRKRTVCFFAKIQIGRLYHNFHENTVVPTLTPYHWTTHHMHAILCAGTNFSYLLKKSSYHKFPMHILLSTYLLFKKSYRAKTLLSICFGGTGSVSRDFSPPFFHDSNPSGALTNMLKLFCIFFRFGQNIRSQSYKIVFNTGVTGRYRTESLI